MISALSPGARRARAVLCPLPALILLGAGCSTPDPRAELEVTDLETYWAVESPVGETQYIAPAVRFNVRNKGGAPHRSIQATATFRRKGEAEAWSSAWQQVSPVAGQPLAPGGSRRTVLKPDNEGRYHSTGTPESMFHHPLFKDAQVDLFLRLGSSPWTKFASVDIERRIGPRLAASASP